MNSIGISFCFKRLALASVLLLTSIAAGTGTDVTLKVRSDLWCPMACPKGDSPGFIIEILGAALAKHQVKMDYDLVNWARAVSDTRVGTYDAIAAAAKTDAPDFVFPDVPQAKVKFELFTLKTKPWKFTGSFAKRKIGVINGYAYDDTVTKLIEKKAPEFVVVSGDSGLESLVKMLRAGRIDALYENPGVFENWVDRSRQNFSDFQSAGAPQQTAQELFVAFGPKVKEAKLYAKWLGEETQAMQKDGRLQALKKKYKLNF